MAKIAALTFAPKSPAEFTPPPCFYYRRCRSAATCECDGKSVCEACAKNLHALTYPLRRPTYEPLYQRSEMAWLLLDLGVRSNNNFKV